MNNAVRDGTDAAHCDNVTVMAAVNVDLTEERESTELEDTSAIEVVNVLLRRRRLLFALPILFATVAVVFALLRPREFTASASFLPQRPESDVPSGAAALARQWGVTLGGERPGYSPQFYADLLSSRNILRKTVEASYTPSDRLAGGARTLIEIYGMREGSDGWQKAIRRLARDLEIAVGKETGVVDVAVSNSDPAIAEQIVARLLELLNEFNLEVRRNKAIEEVRFASARLEEIGDSLNSAESALKTFLERNRQIENSPELRFERDRLQRQVVMRQELYTMLSQSMEQERIESMRDMPVLTVIDRPQDSARKRSRGTIKNAILALFLGTFVAITAALMAEHYRRTSTAHPHVKHEFRQLVKDTLRDLKKPSRMFRGQKKAS